MVSLAELAERAALNLEASPAFKVRPDWQDRAAAYRCLAANLRELTPERIKALQKLVLWSEQRLAPRGWPADSLYTNARTALDVLERIAITEQVQA